MRVSCKNRQFPRFALIFWMSFFKKLLPHNHALNVYVCRGYFWCSDLCHWAFSPFLWPSQQTLMRRFEYVLIPGRAHSLPLFFFFKNWLTLLVCLFFQLNFNNYIVELFQKCGRHRNTSPRGPCKEWLAAQLRGPHTHIPAVRPSGVSLFQRPFPSGDWEEW